MPSRIFNQLDLINVTNGYTVGPTNPASNPPEFTVVDAGTVVFTSFSSLSFSGSNTASKNTGTPAICNVVTGQSSYEVIGTIDFEAVPGIPDGAEILELKYRGTGQVQSHGEAEGSSGLSQILAVFVSAQFNDASQITFNSDLQDQVAGFVSQDVGDGIPHTTEVILDSTYFQSNFGSPTLTKQQLVDNFSNYALNLSIQSVEGAQGQSSDGASDDVNAELDINISVTDWTLEVTYQLFPFQYTMDPPTGTELNPGDLVTITSDPDDPDHLLLDELDIDDVTIIQQTEFLLTFYLPTGYSGPFIVTAVGNGVQFSGSVPLGTYPTLYENASGIYRIVTNKRNDTVYEDSTVDGTTIDIKIPRPFIKGGFIGQ